MYVTGLSSFSTSTNAMHTLPTTPELPPTRLHFPHIDSPHLLRHLSPMVKVTPKYSKSLKQKSSSTMKKHKGLMSLSFYRSEKKLSSDIIAAQQFKKRAYSMSLSSKSGNCQGYRRSLDSELGYTRDERASQQSSWVQEAMQKPPSDNILSDDDSSGSGDVSFCDSYTSSMSSSASDVSMEWDFEDIFNSPASYASDRKECPNHTPSRKQAKISGYENEAFEYCTDSDHIDSHPITPTPMYNFDVGYSNFAFENSPYYSGHSPHYYGHSPHDYEHSPQCTERKLVARRRSHAVVRRVSSRKRSISQSKISRGGKSLLRMRKEHPASTNLKTFGSSSRPSELSYLTKYFHRRSVIARRNRRDKKSASLMVARKNQNESTKDDTLSSLYFDNRAYSCDDRLSSDDGVMPKLRHSELSEKRRLSMPVVMPTQSCGGVCLLDIKSDRRRGQLCDQCTASISRLSDAKQSVQHSTYKTQQQGPADYEVSTERVIDTCIH